MLKVKSKPMFRPIILTLFEGNSFQDLWVWLQTSWKAILAVGGSIATIFGTIVGIWKHRHDIQVSKRNQGILERNQQNALRIAQEDVDNQRFEEIVKGLKSSKIDARAAAAERMLLFVQDTRHERFCPETFNLAVTYLRARKVDKDHFEPDIFYQGIVKIFLETIIHLRKALNLESLPEDERNSVREKSFNASGVHLDGADCNEAQMQYIIMHEATLISATCIGADLTDAWLYNADMHGADFRAANLARARFYRSDLSYVGFRGANLTKAKLIETNLTRGYFPLADLTGADFTFANLTGADFSSADLTGAKFSFANLSGACPERAESLERTFMESIKGYNDPEKRKICKDRGAIFLGS